MKQIVISFLSLSLLAIFFFIGFEPIISEAAEDTDTTTVTLTVDSEISVTRTGTNITMSPNITMSQDASLGNTTFNVKTSDTAGYSLSFKASTSPALASVSDSFTDYTETAELTPETWSVAADAYEFGFSAYGDDVPVAYGSGSSCGTAGADSLTSDLKWLGFNGTTAVTGVASNSAQTSRTGTDTILCVAAEQGNSIYAPSGTYSGTITATATTQ